MTLEDLLLTLRQDILHDRSDRVEGDNDHLWSDVTLVRYLNEAQRRFARRTLCIRDGTTPVTRFSTVALQREYPLDPSVLAVISARFAGNGAYVNGVYLAGAYDTASPPLFVPSGLTAVDPDHGDLMRGGHADFAGYVAPDTRFFDINAFARTAPAKPLAYDTDEFTTADAKGSAGVMNVRLYPIPSVQFAGCQIQLRVARLPSKPLSEQNMEAVPEVPEDYHLALLDYAAYLALRIVDHELGDPARAQEFKASFEVHMVEAVQEMKRKMFSPQQWGFGRNGYSYIGN